MQRSPISLSQIEDPDQLRMVLDEMSANLWTLLERNTALENALRAMSKSSAGLSDKERRVLQALQVGSVETLVAAQKPVIPSYAADPPVNTALPNELIEVGGVVKRFNASTKTWIPITATASSHALLGPAHSDTATQAPSRGSLVKGNNSNAWDEFVTGAALKVIRVNAGATDLEYGNVDDSILSSNVALLNRADQTFEARQIINALNALRIGGTVLNGAHAEYVCKNELLSLAGSATKDTTVTALAGNSEIFEVWTRVETTISGGGVTSFQVGDATTANRFASASLNLTAGSAQWCCNHRKGGVATDATGPTQLPNGEVRITLDAAPTAGALRVVTICRVATAPTS